MNGTALCTWYSWTLRRLLTAYTDHRAGRSYGTMESTQKLLNIIQALYVNFECQVIHNNQLTEPFRVDTGVKQGCIQSPVLFSMAVDWLMRTVTQGRRQGIRWTLSTVLEDLDNADDIGLISNKYQDAQQKSERLSKLANTLNLKVNTNKTQVLRKNTRVNDPVMIDRRHLVEVEDVTYLCTKVTTTGDCDQKINTKIRNTNQAFVMLKPVLRTTNSSVHTKIKIFRSNVLSVLLYGAECWKTTVSIQQKLEVFQTKCLLRILKIYWPNSISNEELRNRTRMDTLAEIIRTRRWLRHVCHMPSNSNTRTALRRTFQVKRKRVDRERHGGAPWRKTSMSGD